MLRTLRQPRYAALSLLMLIVAAGCVAAGTWQISRLEGKVAANDALRANAHATAAPVDTVLPLVGHRTPSTDAIAFRTVTATGTYDSDRQQLVRQRSVGGADGDYVLTPLFTHHGVLLVVRGFVATSSTGVPAVPPAPGGTVTVTARVEPGENGADHAASLGRGQVDTINPRSQAMRLGTQVYAGYAELDAGQPGTAGLTTLPAPDLSNPAGGAVEPQHVAYIIQWYLFALLALAAPFVVARAETRVPQEREIDAERKPRRHVEQEPAEQTAEQARAARLADRYGRVIR